MKPKHTFRGVVLREAPRTPPAGSGLNAAHGAHGGPARVRVGREVAGRAGKGVSVITGLPLDASGLAALATRLKKLCGAGGAVKDGVIEIQGDHRDTVVEILKTEGYTPVLAGG